MSEEDPRLGSLLKQSMDNECDIQIFGFGSHCEDGLTSGCDKGPEEVFKLLPKIGPLFNPELNIDISKLRINWSGIHEIIDNHDDLSYHISQCWALPIIIGGTHDQSFANVMGLMINFPDLDVINIDSNLNVHSNTDTDTDKNNCHFQEMLNLPSFIGQFDEFAIQGNQTSKFHSEYVINNGGNITYLKDIKSNTFHNILYSRMNPLFVSFDLHSICGSDCPGVNNPSVRGLKAEQVLNICLEAGKCKRVVGIDISEYNPNIDNNNTTLQLVCQMIYHFILGYASRGSGSGSCSDIDIVSDSASNINKENKNEKIDVDTSVDNEMGNDKTEGEDIEDAEWVQNEEDVVV
jgi:arginase family enzyme